MSQTFKEKQELAQYFIRSYIAARQGLKKLDVLRSERNLQGDYAEWLAAGLLDLKLMENTVEKGHDAVDKDGRRYQIKSRIVKTAVPRPSGYSSRLPGLRATAGAPLSTFRS